MPADNQRISVRMTFFETWRKHKAQESLEPLEKQLIDIILQHPEYHSMLDKPAEFLDYDYVPTGETNPFLHMGLHLTVTEQITADDPKGVRDIYHALTKKLGSTLAAEHQMMNCIMENLPQVQATEEMINEKNYLEKLKKLL